MRLVLSVLLPGLVVFVSKVNLLQAHQALGFDAADDLATGLRGPNAEATADLESRVNFEKEILAITEAFFQSWSNGKASASAIAGAEEKLRAIFKQLYDPWHRSTQGTFDEFLSAEAGQEYKRVVDIVNHALYPDQALDAKAIPHFNVE